METHRIVRVGSAWLLAACVAMFAALVSLSTPAQAQPAPSSSDVCATFAQPVVVHIEHDVPLRMIVAAVWEGYDWAQAQAFLNGDSCGTPPPRALSALPSTSFGNGETMTLRALAGTSERMFDLSRATGVSFVSAASIICTSGNERAFEAHYTLIHHIPADAGVEDDDAGVPVDAGFVREVERATLHLDCTKMLRNATEPRQWFRESVPRSASIYIGAKGGHDVVLPRGGIARPTELACRSLATLADSPTDDVALVALRSALRDPEPIDASVRAIAITRITNVAVDLARRINNPPPGTGGDTEELRMMRLEVRRLRGDNEALRAQNRGLHTTIDTLKELPEWLGGAILFVLVLAGLFAHTAFLSNDRLAKSNKKLREEFAHTTGVLKALATDVLKLLPEGDARRTSIEEMPPDALGRTAVEALREIIHVITSARAMDRADIERLQGQLEAHHEEPVPAVSAAGPIVPPPPNVPTSFDDETGVSPFPFGDVSEQLGSPEIDMVNHIISVVRGAVHSPTEQVGDDQFDCMSFSERIAWLFWVLSDWIRQNEEARQWHAFWHGSYEELVAVILDMLAKDDPRRGALDPVGRHDLVKRVLVQIVEEAKELRRREAIPPPPHESTRPMPCFTPPAPPAPTTPPASGGNE